MSMSNNSNTLPSGGVPDSNAFVMRTCHPMHTQQKHNAAVIEQVECVHRMRLTVSAHQIAGMRCIQCAQLAHEQQSNVLCPIPKSVPHTYMYMYMYTVLRHAKRCGQEEYLQYKWCPMIQILSCSHQTVNTGHYPKTQTHREGLISQCTRSTTRCGIPCVL